MRSTTGDPPALTGTPSSSSGASTRRPTKGGTMNVRAHMSMLFHLDKCIGCHTCSVACKNLWTDRKGAEYMWWNNVETRPGTGYPTQWENQERLPGRLGAQGRQAAPAAALEARRAAQAVLQPGAALARRLLRAVHLPLPGPVQRAGGRRPADGPPDLAGHRRADRHPDRPELGRRPGRVRAFTPATTRTWKTCPSTCASRWPSWSASCSTICRASATTA